MAVTPPAAFAACATAGNCTAITREAPGKKNRERKYVALRPGKGATPCASPCECRVFRKKKKKGTWEFAFPNADGDIENDDDYDYEGACVTPVLPTNPSTSTAYAPCGGNCELKQKDKEVYCQEPDKPCSSGCECQMFRLKQDDTAAPWEWVAKPGSKSKLTPEKGYYYECICVK